MATAKEPCLESLPIDIIHMIMADLDVVDYFRLRRTSRHFYHKFKHMSKQYCVRCSEITDARKLMNLDVKISLSMDRDIVTIKNWDIAPHLSNLEIRCKSLVNIDLLANIAALQSLSIYMRDGYDLEIGSIRGPKSLKELNLCYNQIVDAKPLAIFRSLEILRLRNNRIVNISWITSLTALTDLDLSCNLVCDVGPISALKKLTILTLSENQYLSNLASLRGLSQLTSLMMNETNVADISWIAGLTSLTSLYLSTGHIGDISPCSSLVMLKQLHLNKNNISGGDLSRLSALTYLDVSDNNIHNLESLQLPRQLWMLCANNNKITNVGSLVQLTCLTRLHLWKNRIDDISPLKLLERLTVLDLRSNHITDVSPLIDFNLDLYNQMTELKGSLDANPQDCMLERRYAGLQFLTRRSLLLTSNPIKNLSCLRHLQDIDMVMFG